MAKKKATRRSYIDTSFYLALLLGEKVPTEMRRIVEVSEFLSSVVLVVEVERNLVRLSREGHLSVDLFDEARRRLKSDLEFFTLRDFTFDLSFSGQFPLVRTPRTLDLIHLRTAQWFQENGGLDFFLTLDKKQARAAEDFGFIVTV